ncbi:MAG: hypothetical protein GAK30_00178 [Paracidovorax wautersii]|uniref:Porin n=1 Tax=Paracidovorax wautersii TaxID=1177982 RepID=A0A7V8JRS9_9BURK|nr:MAG: hypothetical protein GAK30_00178 [Paracidovorax wautersii]
MAPSNCGSSGGACDAYSAAVKYDTGAWGVTLAHDRLRADDGSAFFGQPAGLAVARGSRDDHSYLTGYRNFGAVRLGAGVIRRALKTELETYKSRQYFVSASLPLSAQWVLDLLYTYLDANRKQANAQLPPSG